MPNEAKHTDTTTEGNSSYQTPIKNVSHHSTFVLRKQRKKWNIEEIYKNPTLLCMGVIRTWCKNIFHCVNIRSTDTRSNEERLIIALYQSPALFPFPCRQFWNLPLQLQTLLNLFLTNHINTCPPRKIPANDEDVCRKSNYILSTKHTRQTKKKNRI